MSSFTRTQRLILEQNEEILRILKSLSARLSPRPERIVLCVPTITTKEGDMANLQVACDSIVTIPILVLDAEGQPVAPASGDTFTATPAPNPNEGGVAQPYTAEIAPTSGPNGGPALIITPLVQASPNQSVTVADQDGLTSAVLAFDIVDDLAPKQIQLNAAGATTAEQDVPETAGP